MSTDATRCVHFFMRLSPTRRPLGVSVLKTRVEHVLLLCENFLPLRRRKGTTEGEVRRTLLLFSEERWVSG